MRLKKPDRIRLYHSDSHVIDQRRRLNSEELELLLPELLGLELELLELEFLELESLELELLELDL